MLPSHRWRNKRKTDNILWNGQSVGNVAIHDYESSSDGRSRGITVFRRINEVRWSLPYERYTPGRLQDQM